MYYVPQKAVKGQPLANFFADHQNDFKPQEQCVIGYVTLSPWKSWFDGSKIEFAAAIKFVIESPEKVKTKHSFKLDSMQCTNNQVD